MISPSEQNHHDQRPQRRHRPCRSAWPRGSLAVVGAHWRRRRGADGVRRMEAARPAAFDLKEHHRVLRRRERLIEPQTLQVDRFLRYPAYLRRAARPTRVVAVPSGCRAY